MSTSSRRLSQRAKGNKNNQTAGRDKGPNCQKSELKSWGASVNPYKLSGRQGQRFLEYTDHVKSLNK